MKVGKKMRLGGYCMVSGWLKAISAFLHTQQDISSGRLARLVIQWG